MIRCFILAAVCVLTIFTLAPPSRALDAPPPASAIPNTSTQPFIGLWITRFDYLTAADVRDAIGHAADLGVTDILWQVRGQGDALYESILEPWAEELTTKSPGRKGTIPPFDPLALAVELAHARGLRLHAWVNIMPLWKGKNAPKDLQHPFNAHPEWRLRDAAGTPQPLNDHYVIVNPLLDSVHNHIVNVCKDILKRYPVDGLHMDYVRFVSDTMKDPAAYPGDPRSIAIFEEATGAKWIGSDANKVAFRDFKRQRITDLVRRIRKEAIVVRPGAVFSAAVWRRPDLARESYLQDAALWLNEGTLDRALPMIYSKDDAQFADDVDAWMAAAPNARITPGLGIYLHTPAGSAKQLEISATKRTSGFALFAYASLFKSPDKNQDRTPKHIAERAERLKNITAEVASRRAGRTP